MENKGDFNALIQKYLDGTCSEQQSHLVEDWYSKKSASNPDFEFPESFWQDKEAGLRQILFSSLSIHKRSKTYKLPRRVIAVAATTVIILGIGVLLFSLSRDTKSKNDDISPGTNQATLTLSDSRVFKLTEINNGQVAIDHGTNITKAKNGLLIYESNPRRINVSSKLNTLSTPRGGQYQVVLPDKSRVWLNAGSTLQFPSSFNGLTERKVYLNGEAYFEVTQVKSMTGNHKYPRKMPFIVKTVNQELTVLGTHFNINCYPDEPSSKTTLLEGLVCIFIPSLSKTKTILKPGDQGDNNGHEIKVKKVVIDESVAWKKGDFLFNNETLEFVMRVISRWYDVDIKFEDEALKTIKIGLISSRADKLSNTLKSIGQSGRVHFKVKGKQVIVLKN